VENTITLTIPADWLEELPADEDELRQALMLGLAQLRQQQAAQEASDQVVQALLSTGRAHHLSAALVKGNDAQVRQDPPELPGRPASEILIAQRRGEL
jgi:hypothetical protein